MSCNENGDERKEGWGENPDRGWKTERSKTKEKALYESRNDNFGGNVGM